MSVFRLPKKKELTYSAKKVAPKRAVMADDSTLCFNIKSADFTKSTARPWYELRDIDSVFSLVN
jgi:ABC-type hemin transport system ATPase subunit